MNYQEMDGLLSQHTIDRVELKEIRTSYPRLHGKNAFKTYHGYGGAMIAILLYTDQGAEGWGITTRDPKETRECIPLLTGKKITDIFFAGTGILDEAFLSCDLALHDLAGRILNMPVFKMLNPEARPEAHVYDGAIYMNDIIPEKNPWGIDRVIQDCLDDWERGYRTLKVKIGRGFQWMSHDAGLERDIAVVRKIHEALPAAGIMVDANDGYSVEDAIAFMEGIEGIPLYWFEEPFAEDEANDTFFHQWLDRNRPGTMIADGEKRPDIAQLLSLAQKGCLDVLQPDVCGYGFTPWRKLMKPIVENGYLASPHAWGHVVKTNYCAQLAAAYPHHVPCVEGILGFTEGVDASGYSLKEGVLTIPEKPGFGMELFWGKELEIV